PEPRDRATGPRWPSSRARPLRSSSRRFNGARAGTSSFEPGEITRRAADHPDGMMRPAPRTPSVDPPEIERRSMELLELKEKTNLPREEAAARLREIADELASGNDIVLQSGQLRFVSRVPDEVQLKVEFEVEDGETEFEIELTW